MHPKIVEYNMPLSGPVITRTRTWDEVAGHVLGNLVNRLHVTSAWQDEQETRGETGISLVMVWGSPKSDGTRPILAWYEINI